MSKIFSDVFIKIIETSITSSILISIVFLIRAFMVKKSPRAIVCILWALVGIKLLVPFSIESNFSLVPDISIEYNDLQVSEEAFENVSTESTVVENDIYEENTPISEEVFEEPDVSQNIIINDVQKPAEKVEIEFEESKTDFELSTKETNVKFGNKAIKLLSVIWLIGAFSIGTYGIIKYIKLKKKDSIFHIDNDEIRKCEFIDSPFVFGFINPKIYMPVGISDKTEKFIIIHEKAQKFQR